MGVRRFDSWCAHRVRWRSRPERRSGPGWSVRLPDRTTVAVLAFASQCAVTEEDTMHAQTHSVDPTHVTVDETPVHVRVVADGHVIADTKNGLVVRERGLPVRYYVPPADTKRELLVRTERGAHCPYKGDW